MAKLNNSVKLVSQRKLETNYSFGTAPIWARHRAHSTRHRAHPTWHV